MAYHNHGRWIVDCPNRKDGCGTAWEVNPALTTHLTCHQCGATVRAEAPTEWMQIEAVLSRRPVPATRNWLPGETLQDLLKENRDHGVDYNKSAVWLQYVPE